MNSFYGQMSRTERAHVALDWIRQRFALQERRLQALTMGGSILRTLELRAEHVRHAARTLPIYAHKSRQQERLLCSTSASHDSDHRCRGFAVKGSRSVHCIHNCPDSSVDLGHQGTRERGATNDDMILHAVQRYTSSHFGSNSVRSMEGCER